LPDKDHLEAALRPAERGHRGPVKRPAFAERDERHRSIRIELEGRAAHPDHVFGPLMTSIEIDTGLGQPDQEIEIALAQIA
jgi:hypothetical protein